VTWLVERFEDVNTLPPDRLKKLMEWIARHGVEAADCRPSLTVTSDDDGKLQLHLSQFYRVAGQKVVDHNLGLIATTPLVVDINPADPPPWTVKE